LITLRCTKKLLGRLGASRAAKPGAPERLPTARLGDWHANVLYRPNAELVMFVNDRSLLPVVVPARPGELIVVRFVEALGEVLRRLGVPAEVIEGETAQMAVVQIGPTRSRQILGSMNDFDRMLDYRLASGRAFIDAALELAKAPCGPIAMRRPKDVAVELLASGE
jgi:hypothetical protein